MQGSTSNRFAMNHIIGYTCFCQARAVYSWIDGGGGGGITVCLTAHQHQKGHTVPKQVIMIATSIQVAAGLNGDQ